MRNLKKDTNNNFTKFLIIRYSLSKRWIFKDKNLVLLFGVIGEQDSDRIR